MHIDPSRPTRQPPWRRLCRRLPGDPLSRRCQSSAGQVGHPQSPDQGLVAAAPSPNLPHSPTSRRAGTAPPAFNPHSPSAVKSKQILYEVRDSLLPEQLCVSTPQRILWVFGWVLDGVASRLGLLKGKHTWRKVIGQLGQRTTPTFSKEECGLITDGRNAMAHYEVKCSSILEAATKARNLLRLLLFQEMEAQGGTAPTVPPRTTPIAKNASPSIFM